MRELTFKGFLSFYVKKLSGLNTVSIVALTNEICSGNHRLCAPLVLYSIAHNKSALLQKELTRVPNTIVDVTSAVTVLSNIGPDTLESSLESGNAPYEYLKVWRSFKVRKERFRNDAELKEKMRMKIIQLQKSKCCSNYRLYKDLNLNPGNINSWLRNGNSAKVSYATASRIVTYLISYKPSTK